MTYRILRFFGLLEVLDLENGLQIPEFISIAYLINFGALALAGNESERAQTFNTFFWEPNQWKYGVTFTNFQYLGKSGYPTLVPTIGCLKYCKDTT